MAVPESVRKVPRPVNTIVSDNGKDGPNRYPVRERNSVKYVSGGNPQPQNGKVIGHIVDGAFIPLGSPAVKAEPDMLSYGACAFVRSVSQDLFSELLGVYTPKDTYTIMAIASLRVIKPEVSAKRLQSHYLLFRTLYAAKAARNRQIQCPLSLMEKDEKRVIIHEAFS